MKETSQRVDPNFRPHVFYSDDRVTQIQGEVVKSFVKYLNLSVGTVTGRSDLVEHGGRPRLDDNCRDDDQHGSVRSIGVGISSDAADIGSEVSENLVGGSCEEDLKYFHDYDIGLRHSQQESDKKYNDRSKRVKKRTSTYDSDK